MTGLKLSKKNFRLKRKWKQKGPDYGTPGNLGYRTSMGGLKPGAYVMPEAVIELLDNIDSIVDRFFEDAAIDELNTGAFLDEYIDYIIELGRTNLKQQALEHQHIIEGIQSVERGELFCCMSQQREVMKKIEGEKESVKEAKENEEKPKRMYKEVIA